MVFRQGWPLRQLRLYHPAISAMLYAVRHGGVSPAGVQRSRNRVQRMADRITAHIWRRLEKSYPGIEAKPAGQSIHIFAKGLCLDKLVWVKDLYPPMDRAIEKVPPVTGKIATWAVVFVMVCNGLLTGAAMLRYNTRVVRPAATGIVEQFLDSQYDDNYIEHRWPNMIVTES